MEGILRDLEWNMSHCRIIGSEKEMARLKNIIIFVKDNAGT